MVTTPAHSAARFNLAQAAVWLAASRRRLEGVRSVGPLNDIEAGLTLTGEAWQGLMALEQGLLSLRWVVTNDPRAAGDMATLVPLDRVHQAWGRLRVLRNEVLVHSDSWLLGDPNAKVVVDSVGVHASNGHAFGFDDWQSLLDILEPFTRRWLAQPTTPSHRKAVRPSPVELVNPPLPEPGPLPPAGAVWFGVAYAPDTYVLAGQSNRLAPGLPVACVGRLANVAVDGGARVRVSRVDGPVLYVGERAEVTGGTNLLATTVRGLNEPGDYIVTFVDDTGDALAEGLVQVLEAQLDPTP